MKKVLSFLIVAVIAFNSAIICYAGDDSVTYGASYTATMAKPTIDGVYSASEGWGAPLVVINADTLSTVVAKATSSGAANVLSNQSEIVLYMKWDSNYLYFATVRKGHAPTSHFSSWAAGGVPAWQFCATQLHFINNWSKITNPTALYTAQPIDTYVASATTNYTDVALASYKSAYTAANTRLNLADGYKVAITNVNNTEACEIAIPWNKLSTGNQINPQDGTSFYLGVVIHNSNSTVSRVYGKTGSANGENFTNKDYYLNVNLSEDVASSSVFSDMGFSIRTSDPQGLRAKYMISKGTLAATVAQNGFKVKEYGALLTQRESYDASTGITNAELKLKSDLSEEANTAKLMIWKDGEYHGSIYKETADGLIYTAVLTNILDANLNKDYVYRPYCIVEDAQGNQSAVYGNVSETSIYDIAKLALADPENGLTQAETNYIQANIVNVVEGGT